MNVTFTTVILANSNNVSADDLRLSVKVSVICNTDHVPILNDGFPILVQQVKEFKGKRSFGKLCIEDGSMILPNIKTLNACAIQAAANNTSMQVAQQEYLLEVEANKAKAAAVKTTFAADNNLFVIMETLEEMGVKKYCFRNPEKLKDSLFEFFTATNSSQSVRDQFRDKLTKLNFTRVKFCGDYTKYLKDQKMVAEAMSAEAPLELF